MESLTLVDLQVSVYKYVEIVEGITIHQSIKKDKMRAIILLTFFGIVINSFGIIRGNEATLQGKFFIIFYQKK